MCCYVQLRPVCTYLLSNIAAHYAVRFRTVHGHSHTCCGGIYTGSPGKTRKMLSILKSNLILLDKTITKNITHKGIVI